MTVAAGDRTLVQGAVDTRHDVYGHVANQLRQSFLTDLAIWRGADGELLVAGETPLCLQDLAGIGKFSPLD